jgi:hypothetical protein
MITLSEETYPVCVCVCVCVCVSNSDLETLTIKGSEPDLDCGATGKNNNSLYL